jgi:hypothetical protein
MNVLAGADFFTVEVLTWRGLATYYVLFFHHLESRRVRVAGITRHPNQEWMEEIARSATQESWGHLDGCRYLLRHQVLRLLSINAGGGRSGNTPASGPKSESECLCRTLGAVGQAGVPGKVDSVR